MPLAEVLSFLEETRGVPTWTVQDLAKSLKISAAVANRVISFLRVQGYVEPATLLQRAIQDEIKFPSSKSWDQLCPHKLGWNRAANLGCSATSIDGETVSGLQPLTTLDPT
jgi:hypothetical protein